MLSNRALSVLGIALAWPVFSFILAMVVSGWLGLGHAAIALWMPALHFGIIAGIIHLVFFVVSSSHRTPSLVVTLIVAALASPVTYLELCVYLNEPFLPLAQHLALTVSVSALTIPWVVYFGAVRPCARMLTEAQG